MFCNRCTEILSQQIEPLTWVEEDNAAFFIQHETFEGLEDSIKEGCHICSLFMQDVVEAERDLLRRKKPNGLVSSAVLQKATLLDMPGSFILAINLDSDIETESMKEKRNAPFLMLILQPTTGT